MSRWIGVCAHCGDVTEEDDDPAPDLCAMCEKAGRGRGDVRVR